MMFCDSRCALINEAYLKLIESQQVLNRTSVQLADVLHDVNRAQIDVAEITKATGGPISDWDHDGVLVHAK